MCLCVSKKILNGVKKPFILRGMFFQKSFGYCTVFLTKPLKFSKNNALKNEKITHRYVLIFHYAH